MDITRFGHSALLVHLADKRIVIDPGAFSSDAVFALPNIDAIIVTHQHADHIDQSRVARLLDANPHALRLAPPDTAQMLGWPAHNDGDVTELDSVSITGIGRDHAVIYPELDRVNNVGVVISAPGEPTLFHPGDSYGSIPRGVDFLALPLSAPWTKIAETIDFARAVAPRSLFAIHDATISELAYDIYFNHVATFSQCADARRIGPDQTAIFP